MTDTLTETTDELTPEQYALLDALRDVALSPDAPYAKLATEQIARLAGEAFGYPLPPVDVVRTGGFADIFLGRPMRTDQLGKFAEGGPIPRRPASAGIPRRVPGTVELSVVDSDVTDAEIDDAIKAGVADADRWPFGPGTIVRDEDGNEIEWLEAAPEGVVVRSERAGAEWTRTKTGWSGQTSEWISQFAPLTVVSVPDMDEACADDAPAGNE